MKCGIGTPAYDCSSLLKDSSCSPTQALVEALAYPGQDRQGYEVTKTGSNGCGYVVWVDARLLRSHNYTHHDDT